MNDNLRYISLQYIKGYNYEKITCFHSKDIKTIKKILDLPYIIENYEILEKILKKEKHEIGESLLEDLINYISLKDLKEDIEDAIKKKTDEASKENNDDFEKLIKIFKKYLYICENNIKKYERIFDYNEIGNIDEAFMIESYSKFLKKLHKLKQNLETKDTEKIKRALINSLDQFFNLHGFNSPDKIDNQAEIDYIVDRIFNYT
jgi:hypothetical protein